MLAAAVVAGALFSSAGVANAASVVCGDLTLGTRTVTIDPALTGGLCYAQNGNLQNQDIADLGLITVDKDVTGEFPPGGDASEGWLQFTRDTVTSGTWTFASTLWDLYESLYIAFHYGNAGNKTDTNPDSFVVQLAPDSTTGTYALGGGELNGLSNIYLLGIRCTDPNGCDTDPFIVPTPGTLGLLGIAMAGLGFAARRRQS